MSEKIENFEELLDESLKTTKTLNKGDIVYFFHFYQVLWFFFSNIYKYLYDVTQKYTCNRSVQLAVFIENGFYFYLYHELEAMMETF